MRNLAVRGIVALGVAWTVSTPAAFGQSKLDAGVERTLSEIGNARVLVMMTAPKLGEASSAAFREPDGFVADLLGERGRNVQRIVGLPVVVVETDRRGIYDLVDDPHVAYVVADEPAPPLLETSLRTLHVDEVHATGVPSASADRIESAVRATARRTTDPRTGLVLHFPDAREALDALARSGEQAEPGAGEWSVDADATFLAGIAGARRIVVQGGARATAMPADELAELVSRVLGSDVTVWSLGKSTFVAESRTGFSAESLSRLLGALGPDTRLYRDDPVSPSAVR